jgi:hypothetical protein
MMIIQDGFPGAVERQRGGQSRAEIYSDIISALDLEGRTAMLMNVQ